ncbi:MAG: cyclic nucleotide-binding domain-containing protein [Helicobacteraceae bacterium]|nr:cyclic nucleotide-binding domain-containing protein [Helicobacteraceae bacterium]
MSEPEDKITYDELSQNLERYSNHARNGRKILVTKDKMSLFYMIKASIINNIINSKNKEISELKSKIDELATPPKTKSVLNEAQLTLIKVKNRLQFFDSINDEALASICANVRILKVKKGETVFDINDDGEEIYFIIKGSVNVVMNKKIIVTLHIKDVFGEMAYITKQPRSASVISNDNATALLRFNIKAKAEVGEEDIYTQIFKNFANILSDRLVKANCPLDNMGNK